MGGRLLSESAVGEGAREQRFVVCHNPEGATRDQQVRANLVAYLETQIAGSDEWTKSRRDELAGRLRTTPALWRLVRRLGDGRFRIDKAASASPFNRSSVRGWNIPAVVCTTRDHSVSFRLGSLLMPLVWITCITCAGRKGSSVPSVTNLGVGG